MDAVLGGLELKERPLFKVTASGVHLLYAVSPKAAEGLSAVELVKGQPGPWSRADILVWLSY